MILGVLRDQLHNVKQITLQGVTYLQQDFRADMIVMPQFCDRRTADPRQVRQVFLLEILVNE